MTETQAEFAFRHNQVDAVFRVRPPGNKSIQELVQNGGGRLVAIDQAEAMKINQPGLEAAFIPKGAYQGNPLMGEIRQELFTVLKEVVQELDEDRIAPESFQSFTFTWEAALTAVRDREILISRQAATRR